MFKNILDYEIFPGGGRGLCTMRKCIRIIVNKKCAEHGSAQRKIKVFRSSATSCLSGICKNKGKEVKIGLFFYLKSFIYAIDYYSIDYYTIDY